MATVPAVRFLQRRARGAGRRADRRRRRARDRRLRAGHHPRPLRVRHPRRSPSSARSASSTGSAPACTASAAAASLTVVIGGVLLAVTLAYAELLRRYGTPGPGRVAARRRALDAATTSAPSRARSRRCSASRRSPGAATCGPGAARAGGSARSASPPPRRSRSALNPTITRTETGLAVLYGLVVGVIVGLVLIRVDLALTARADGAAGGPRRRRRCGPSRAHQPAASERRAATTYTRPASRPRRRSEGCRSGRSEPP